MTAFALVSGRLFRAPEAKTSRAGKPFALARLRDGEGEAATWWEILAFNADVVAELLKLKAGDGVSVNGTLRVELFTGRDGQPRIAHKLLVEGLLSTRKAKRPPQRDRGSAGPRELDDDARYLRG